MRRGEEYARLVGKGGERGEIFLVDGIRRRGCGYIGGFGDGEVKRWS